MASVNTVTGPISAGELGVTNFHTHLLVDLRPWFVEPEEASRRHFADVPVSLENLGAIRQDALANKDNLFLGDIDAAVSEAAHFKKLGGNSMVETSPRGIGRDPLGLLQISNATGINIVCCTGFYVGASHPSVVAQSTREELAALMVSELTQGIGTTGIRAGVLKIGMGTTTGGPFASEGEEKAFHAAVRAQAETGAALEIHPARPYTERHWDTYFDLIEEGGGDLSKTCACHMEFWAQEFDYQRSLLERGVTVGFDQFGSEERFATRGDGYPPDALRIDAVARLAEAGYEEQVVISNEVCLKCGYVKFGGHGYGHVLSDVVPSLKSRGVSDVQLRSMLVENPKRLLPF